MVHVYGIPTCGSVRKALDFFKEREIAVTFHNFKTERPDPALITQWLSTLPGEVLLNRKGRTWRELPEIEKLHLADCPESLPALLLAYPLLIKRPVVVFPNGPITAGFCEDIWLSAL